MVYLQQQQQGEKPGLLNFLANFTPVIEPEPSGSVFLEISRQKVRKLLRELGHAGFCLVVGIGSNRLLARAAVLAGTRQLGRLPGLVQVRMLGSGVLVFAVAPGAEAAFVSALPVELLWTLPEKTRLVLRNLGLATAGDVARIGERELRAHFGASAALIAAHSQGVDPQRVRPLYPPPDFTWRRVLGGVARRPVLEAALAAGARYLVARLRREAKGYRCLCLELELDGGERRAGERRFPTHVAPDPERMIQQLLLLLDSLPVNRPVDELRVTASALYRLEPGQVSLFSPEVQAADGLARVVTALGARYPGRLVRGQDLRLPVRRREQMLALYDPFRGRLVTARWSGDAQDR